MAGSGDFERACIIGRDFVADLEEEESVDGRLTSVISPQDLTKLLECPVCYEIILPPVLMCASGHNICLDCRNKCMSCPICRGTFLHEARNHLAESIVDKCSFICRYHTLGCNIILSGHQMVKHLHQDCEYRPVTCRDCKRKIPFDSYLSHLSDYENIPKQLATECSTGFDIEEDDFAHEFIGGQTWEPTWLHCLGVDFFCYLESSSSHWWIYVIGFAPDNILEGFMYDVLVWNQVKAMESRFIGPVHSYRKTGSEILQTGKCLKTTEQGILAMMNQGGIDTVVRIFRASDYQPPKSRNTGQPIHSPLSLRTSSTGGNESLVTTAIPGQSYQQRLRLPDPTMNNHPQQPQQLMDSAQFDNNNNNYNNNQLQTPDDETVIYGTANQTLENRQILVDSASSSVITQAAARLEQWETPHSSVSFSSQNNNSSAITSSSETPSNSNINQNTSFPQQVRRRLRSPRGIRRQQQRLYSPTS